MRDSKATLAPICEKLGLEPSDTLKKFTWNGQTLKEVYPWGTIRTPTPEANLATARELSSAQVEEIRASIGRRLRKQSLYAYLTQVPD